MSIRRSKFGARTARCQAANHAHPSALEAAVCDLLHLRVKARDISDLKYIAPVQLPFGVRWKVDFSFIDREGVPTWAEAKGMEDRGYKLKLKMWRNGAGPGPLEIWKGTWKSPKLVETVIPKAVKLIGLVLLALATTGCTWGSAAPVKFTPIDWPHTALTPQPERELQSAWADRDCPTPPEPTPCVCETPEPTNGETE